MGTLVKCGLLHILRIWLHWGEENSHCSVSGMGLIVTAHSSQASASTQSELNLLPGGLKIAERQGGEKKNLLKTYSTLCKKRKPEIIGACAEWGGTKPSTQRVTRQWMHESGLFRSPLLELYSTLASWQKIAPWMEAPPPRPLTIVALVINRQRTHRGRPAAEMSACSRGYQEDNSRLWRSYQVVDRKSVV